VQLQKTQDSLFYDNNNGGYFGSSKDSPSLLLRLKEEYDGAEPNYNSVTVLNLARLSAMNNNEDYIRKAEKTKEALSSMCNKAPMALPQLLASLDYLLEKPKQIIIAGDLADERTKALLRVIHSKFIPIKILLLADGREGQLELANKLPFIKDMKPINGKPTAYVCKNYGCELPVNTPEQLEKLLI